MHPGVEGEMGLGVGTEAWPASGRMLGGNYRSFRLEGMVCITRYVIWSQVSEFNAPKRILRIHIRSFIKASLKVLKRFINSSVRLIVNCGDYIVWVISRNRWWQDERAMYLLSKWKTGIDHLQPRRSSGAVMIHNALWVPRSKDSALRGTGATTTRQNLTNHEVCATAREAFWRNKINYQGDIWRCNREVIAGEFSEYENWSKDLVISAAAVG